MDIRHRVVVFDTNDIDAESAFWAAVVNGTVLDEDGWRMILVDHDPVLAVQYVPDHRPPEWPDGLPQQVHLDLWVNVPQAAHDEVMLLGAKVAQPTIADGRERWTVYTDPAGHPFCFCWIEE